MSFSLVPMLSPSQNQTTQIIEDLRCQVMSFLFGGKPADSLETMRYNIFSKKVVSSSWFVTPERLRPTESATKISLSQSVLPDHGLDGNGGGYGSHELGVEATR